MTVMGPRVARYEAAARLHRRLAGVLAHPLRRYVWGAATESEEAKVWRGLHILREWLGLSEEASAEIGAEVAAREIRVRLGEDGRYRFSLTPEFEDAPLEPWEITRQNI